MSFKIPFEHVYVITLGFPGGSVVKNPPANAGNAGDVGDPGGRNGNPHQYSCLETPMDRGVWGATVCEVTKSRIPLSNRACTCDCFKERTQALVNF